VDYLTNPASLVVDEPGQQTFLNLSEWRTPQAQSQAARPPITTDAPRYWSVLVALIAFRAHLRKNLDDEEAAYAALLDDGCPLMLADSAWDRHAAGVGSR
jgi:hypothetical protein